MRCIGMVFQAWLAGRIGAAGIGLYQLVMSVELLATTFAISGIRFAVTRLVAEEIGLGRGGGVGGAMSRCAAYSLVFGAAACVILYLFAEPIGFLWIGDARTVMSLRILAFGLPFIALSSVLSGYFTACGRIWKPSLVHLLEQLACAGLVVLFLGRAPEGDIERSCAAVASGVTAADMLSLGLMLCFYLGDRRRHAERGGGSVRLTARMFGVALPLAVSAYARSALSTLEHLLVPRGFRRSGLSADAALAGYGVIQGMAMPIIGFPSCLPGAVAELTIPTLTEAQQQGSGQREGGAELQQPADDAPYPGRISPHLRRLLAGRCPAALALRRAAGRGGVPLLRSRALHPAARAARSHHVHGHDSGRLPQGPGSAGVEHGHQYPGRRARRRTGLAAAASRCPAGVHRHNIF